MVWEKDLRAIGLLLLQRTKCGAKLACCIAISTSLLSIATPTLGMDMHVHKADAKAVVQGIAKTAGFQLMGAEQIEGTLELDLEGMNAKDILFRIGEMKGFSLVEEGKTLLIAPNHGKGLEQAIVLEAQHLRPEVVAEALEAIVKKEQIRVVSATNQVVVYGSLQEREMAKTLIESLDKVPKQVKLEARIIALRSGYLKEQGIQWGWQPLTRYGKEETSSYGAIRFGKAPSGDPYSFFFKPELSAIEETANGTLIAAPNMMTMNGVEGKILIGDKVPVQVETKENGETRSSIRYEEAGIKLQYTHYVEGDGSIDATMMAEVSTPELVKEMKAYRMTTRQASTRVRLKSGEVLVIGGLMDTREERTFRKIPILGDIPVLGKLFRYARKSKDQVELVIALRATVCEEGM